MKKRDAFPVSFHIAKALEMLQFVKGNEVRDEE